RPRDRSLDREVEHVTAREVEHVTDREVEHVTAREVRVRPAPERDLVVDR
ncbi:MAG: hypothetical protein HOM37_13210, partial [Acidimicrobiaceae bacterium]|nr:hypothetical protein [Acidimicrobiaceae bacterium]